MQWNLALTAGDASGRYFRFPGRPSLGGRGARAGERELVMVDEWIGVELALASAEPAECAWAPVETVSLSEAGLERIYQGSSIVWCWPLRLGARRDARAPDRADDPNASGRRERGFRLRPPGGCANVP